MMEQKPFTMAYVMRLTTKYMRQNIDVSIRKTFERVPEFANDRERSEEVFKTLAYLHALRKGLDDFQKANSEAFRGQ